MAEKMDRVSVVYHRKDGQWKVRFRQSDPSRVPFCSRVGRDRLHGPRLR